MVSLSFSLRSKLRFTLGLALLIAFLTLDNLDLFRLLLDLLTIDDKIRFLIINNNLAIIVEDDGRILGDRVDLHLKVLFLLPLVLGQLFLSPSFLDLCLLDLGGCRVLMRHMDRTRSLGLSRVFLARQNNGLFVTKLADFLLHVEILQFTPSIDETTTSASLDFRNKQAA